jgi:hypothetical protein
MRMKKSISFLAPILFSAVLLTACTARPTGEGQNIIDDSFAAMQALSSYTTSASLHAVSSASPDNALDLEITTSADNTGRSLLRFNIAGDPSSNEYIYRSAPDVYYSGNDDSGTLQWGAAFTAADFLQVGSYFFMQLIVPLDEQIRTSLIAPTQGNEETINGVACHHITADIDPSVYMAFLFGGGSPADVGLGNIALSGTADYWIGKSDHLIQRAQSVVMLYPAGSDPETTTESITITTSIDFTSFGQPVTFPTP